MIETHPFEPFVPYNAKYLFLGSFPGRFKVDGEWSYNWFYGNKRNHFWQILSKIYGINLESLDERKLLLMDMQAAITDIIYACERQSETNLDTNLVNITYNIEQISRILKENHIEKIFFTSKFVEHRFKKFILPYLKDIENVEFIVLPSPSPRYAAMSLVQKAEVYAKFLLVPNLKPRGSSVRIKVL